MPRMPAAVPPVGLPSSLQWLPAVVDLGLVTGTGPKKDFEFIDVLILTPDASSGLRQVRGTALVQHEKDDNCSHERFITAVLEGSREHAPGGLVAAEVMDTLRLWRENNPSKSSGGAPGVCMNNNRNILYWSGYNVRHSLMAEFLSIRIPGLAQRKGADPPPQVYAFKTQSTRIIDPSTPHPFNADSFMYAVMQGPDCSRWMQAARGRCKEATPPPRQEPRLLQLKTPHVQLWTQAEGLEDNKVLTFIVLDMHPPVHMGPRCIDATG